MLTSRFCAPALLISITGLYCVCYKLPKGESYKTIPNDFYAKICKIQFKEELIHSFIWLKNEANFTSKNNRLYLKLEI